MRPLYVLLHWLDGYQTGKRNKPLSNNTQITEFRKLNEAAIRYVERTEQMFEQQNSLSEMLHTRYKLHLLFAVTDWKC